MHTDIKVKAIWKKMEKLFNSQLNTITIKFYELSNKDNEENYNENNEYFFNVTVRHWEWVDCKKEIENFLNNI